MAVQKDSNYSAHTKGLSHPLCLSPSLFWPLSLFLSSTLPSHLSIPHPSVNWLHWKSPFTPFAPLIYVGYENQSMYMTGGEGHKWKNWWFNCTKDYFFYDIVKATPPPSSSLKCLMFSQQRLCHSCHQPPNEATNEWFDPGYLHKDSPFY